jgi:tetratricopeptide (TPR) repeat protein
VRTAIATLFASLVLASPAAAQPEPKTAKEFFERGRARAELGFAERAIEDFTEAIKLDPKHARAYSARGAARAQQAPDKALADLDEAIKLDPKLAEAFAERGQLYARKGEYEKALKDHDEAIKLDPKRAEWYGRRAVALFYSGHVEESLADLDEAIKLEPKEIGFYINRSQFRLGRGKDLAGALKDADEAVRLEPKNPIGHFQRAHVQSARGEWAEARKSIDEAIRLGPNDAGSYIARAELLACCPDPKQHDSKQAFKDADRACELSGWKDPYALEVLAAAAAALGDFAGAVKWQKKAMEDPAYAKNARRAQERLTSYEAKRAIRLPPPIRDASDAREFVTRGNHYFVSGDLEQAIRDYDEAIRLDPKSAKAYYGRACARVMRDEDSKAVADFTQAIKLDPKDVSSYVDRSIVRVIRGEWEGALADCDEALKLDPKHLNALVNRAVLRAACPDASVRDAKKALADATQACQLTNWKVGYALEGYAAACAAAGDFDEAVKWQTRAAADEEYMARRGATARYRVQLYEAKKPLRLGPPRKPD